MAVIDTSTFSNLAGSLVSALPAPQAIVEQVLTGAAASVVLSGVKAQMGAGGSLANLDLLGLSQHPGGAANNNPNTVVGPTITSSAFATLSAADKAGFYAAGGHIVVG